MMPTSSHPLQAQYDQLWHTACAHFARREFLFDDLLDNPRDDRRGVTVLIRPTREVVANIQDFLTGAQALEPEQYYYHPTEIHVTVLSIISCYAGFRLPDLALAAYCDLIQAALRDVPPLTIQFTGLTASPACIMIQGFPLTEHLDTLRAALRARFKQSTLAYTIDTRYTITTAHCTVMRFKKNLLNPQRFLDYIAHYRQANFGSSLITDVEFVYNDWYQRRDQSRLLARFPLGAA